jgi:transposase-like protein
MEEKYANVTNTWVYLQRAIAVYGNYCNIINKRKHTVFQRAVFTFYCKLQVLAAVDLC